ncbi:hypothetical protein GCM10009127_20910 [Alteraurantiacibacter aestuarii]|uniref:Hpt domain-containing protein n=1 Tax=Alteraurantiacibacter aestuarii TaxID=650004 RepID=UPI0031D050AD
MAYEAADFDANLVAAAGDDTALRAELRACFMESLRGQLDLLQRSRCDGNWEVAALRLRALGTSFHALELMRLADEALDSAPGDPVILRKLRQFVEEFANRS